MATINVNPVPTFDPHGDPNTMQQKWKRWLRSFELYSDAAGCDDDKRKRKLLLHSTGPDVQDIFDTLTETGEDYKTAADKLTMYFTSVKNVPYNRHVFRQENQAEGEIVSQFVTRLRTLSIGCDFGQADDFIRDEVIDKCHSKSLRTKLLAEKDLTLTKLLDIPQAKEASESRAAHFANPDAAFIAKSKKHYRKSDKKKLPSEPDKKKLKCYKCGFKGHVADECRCSKNVKCFKCGKIGHFQSMCRSEKSKIDKSQSKPGYAVDKYSQRRK